MSQLALLAISAATFFGYLFYTTITKKLGISRSISRTYYQLKKKNRWIFQVATWVYAITLGLAGGSWPFYIAAGLVSLVGFAPNVKKSKFQERMHVIGATGGIVAAMAALLITSNYSLWYLPVIQVAFSLPAMKASLKFHTYWIEVLAYILTAGGILSMLI